MKQDTRIPVTLGQQPGTDDAVLLEEGFPAPAAGHIVRFATARAQHSVGCLCCAPRTAAAAALAQAFHDRVTGAAPYYSRLVVVASENGNAELRLALMQDALARARYRLVD